MIIKLKAMFKNKITRIKRILPLISKFSLQDRITIILKILLDKSKIIN
jgi:hypothetical protein